MPPLPDATGVVLAGGGSRRFGSNKLLAPYRGMPLLHHPVLRLVEVCGDVVVVVAPGAPDPGLPLGVPARIVRDAAEGQGPLAGVLAGVQAASADLAFLVGGDMPELSTSVLLEMLAVASQAPVEGVVLADDEGPRPLPALVRAERAGQVAHGLLHDGERRLRSLIDSLRVAVIDTATWRGLDPEGRTLRDVDRPEDLGA